MHRINAENCTSLPARLGILAAALCLGATAHAQLQIPAVVFSQANGLDGIYASVQPNTGEYNGTVGHIAANSRGDIIGDVSANGGAYVVELPINGGPQTALLTAQGSLYGGHSVFVDKSNNIWVTDTGDAKILFIPFVNNAYPTGVTYGSLGTCAYPVPAGQTSDCVVALNYQGVDGIGGYCQGADIALDGPGNLYLLCKYVGSGATYSGDDVAIQFSAATGNGVVIGGGLSNDANGEIAVNSAGDLFIEVSGTVTEYSHNDYTTAIPVGGLTTPSGVSMDASGNLFITDNNGLRIIEFPYANGTYGLPASTPFVVSNQLLTPFTSYWKAKISLGVAIDSFGRITMAGYYPNSLSTLAVGHQAFAAEAVGTTSGTQTLNMVFNTAADFGSFSTSGPFAISTAALPTGDAPCSGSYVAGGNCSVGITYTATAAGLQLGAIYAWDASGNLLGSAVLSGSGLQATLNVDPGTNSTDGSGFVAPAALATDALGNIYVADGSTGAIYRTATGSTAKTTVATGFSSPSAVAVDGSGDLFVADTGNSQIVEIPYSAATSTYGNEIVLFSGVSGPSGLALDQFGDLFVADSGNARVLLLASTGNMPPGSNVTTIGSGFVIPIAVAFDDTNQNLYVSDVGTGTVVQINILTLAQANVISGMKTAAGVAVDPSGSVYAVDSGSTTITRLPFINGGVNPNFETALASVVALPNAIAADSLGNLYVADTTNGVVATDQRSIGLLDFGNVAFGQTSGTVSGQLSDGGTASLTLSTPYYTESGATTSFAIQSSSTCTAGNALTPGQSCTVAATFSPQAYGALADTLALTSSAPNAASLALSGTGTQELIKSTLTLAVTSGGAPVFGQPVTVTATLVPVIMANAAPTGHVTFAVDSVIQQPSLLLNSATGTASIVLPNLTGGQHTITASYSGDDLYSSTSSSPLIVSVATSTTTTTAFVNAPDTNPTAANPSTPTTSQIVTLTAVVTPPLSGTPTGTVTFYSGTTVLGSANVAPLSVTSTFSAGQANLQVNTSANPLPLGQYEITATYNGDTNYSGSTSAQAVPLLIANPTVTLTPSSTNVIGGGDPITISIASVAGFAAAINFSCSGLPQYAACSFGPAYASVNPTSPAQVQFKVVVNQPPPVVVPSGLGALPKLPGRRTQTFLLALALFLPSLLLGYLRRSNRKLIRLLSSTRLSAAITFLLLAGCAVALSGCGSTTEPFTTPKGTDTITVNAIATVAGSTTPAPTASIQLNLTVQ